MKLWFIMEAYEESEGNVKSSPSAAAYNDEVVLESYGGGAAAGPEIVNNSDIIGIGIGYIHFHTDDELFSIVQSMGNVGGDRFNDVLMFPGQYIDDIYKALLESEQSRIIITKESNELNYRSFLVSLMFKSKRLYNLKYSTLHLACYVLDAFMANCNVHLGILRLLAATCIVVASKFEESATCVKFSSFNENLLDGSFCLDDFYILEKRILFFLEFGLMIPTVVTFIEYFSKTTIILDDYYMYVQSCDGIDRFGTYENMLTTINVLLYEIVDANLINISCFNILPSLRAAACVGLARSLWDIEPVWSAYLVELTHYTYEEIAPIMSHMHGLYDLKCKYKFSKSTPDTQAMISNLVNEENSLNTTFNERANNSANNTGDSGLGIEDDNRRVYVTSAASVVVITIN